ncbi:type IVB secretion system protein IcmH/DotU [Variovorax sp. RCC_210]|uniref:type IVB secretion system protein IcmH/DotU n=1 Tax=Variovorax sp. RCC_210 TaxID=3239217 RepID=UPI003524B0CF
MPLREDFTLAAHNHFEQLAQRLVAAANPEARPQPLLASQQPLARLSPQPDRLVAVRASRVLLIEAARPLLLALVRLPERRGAAQADAVHSDLADQVPAFQSVCTDALVRQEYITGASYVLCTALDEKTAGLPPYVTGRAEEPGIRGQRQLAVRFHGDGRGGQNVFLFMASLLKNPPEHIDLLELLLIVVALGFEGMYRNASNGKRALDEIRHAVFEAVRSCRGEAVPAAHWSLIENLLWGRVKPGELADAQEEMFR